MSEEELRRRSDGIETPEALDLGEMTEPAYDDAGGDESPDLNPDGSLKTDSKNADGQGFFGRVRAMIPW